MPNEWIKNPANNYDCKSELNEFELKVAMSSQQANIQMECKSIDLTLLDQSFSNEERRKEFRVPISGPLLHHLSILDPERSVHGLAVVLA